MLDQWTAFSHPCESKSNIRRDPAVQKAFYRVALDAPVQPGHDYYQLLRSLPRLTRQSRAKEEVLNVRLRLTSYRHRIFSET